MNKELKFRAWIPKWIKGKPVMREVYTINFHGYPIIKEADISVLAPDNSDYLHIPYTEFELMQYINFKDSNNKDIYVGDIYKYNYEYDADYDGDMPIVKTMKGIIIIKNICDTSWIVKVIQEGGFGEVIGNKYQNPELIPK